MTTRRAILAGAIGLGLGGDPGPASAQSAANQWFALRGDDDGPVPNTRLPIELVEEIDDLPGVIWGGGGPAPGATLVEFYDLNCPWCRAFVRDLPELMAANPDLRVGLAANPILSAGSVQGAKVVVAALASGGGKTAHDLVVRLLAGPRVDGPAALAAAAALGLDRAAVERAADGAETRDALRRQTKLAASLGLTATPSFVAGGAGILGYPGPRTMTRIVGAVRSCGTVTC